MVRPIRKGSYRVVGIPGQSYDPECILHIDSMTNTCKLNARVTFDGLEAEGGYVESIDAANFRVALDEGWVVPMSEVFISDHGD